MDLVDLVDLEVLVDLVDEKKLVDLVDERDKFSKIEFGNSRDFRNK